MKVSLLLLLTLLVLSTALQQEQTPGKDDSGTKVGGEEEEEHKEEGCTVSKQGKEGCAKSRKKRTVNLPNQTALRVQSRLIIPQIPVGLYLVWVKVRFFVRTMFTDDLSAASGDISSLIAAGGRSMDNLLIRSVATDQHNVFSAIGEAFNKAGLDGKQCVLRAVCELEETPVKHWSIIGDMVTTLLQPKRGDNTTLLEEYHRAQDIGADSAANGNKGDCWSYFPNCPLSLFNFIPDVYTKDDHIEIELDQSEMGSNTITDPEEIDKLLKLYPDVKPIDIDLDLTNM